MPTGVFARRAIVGATVGWVRVWLPSLVVVALAVAGPWWDVHTDVCASTDGPQFKCWLVER
jgi:hypothetical protein